MKVLITKCYAGYLSQMKTPADLCKPLRRANRFIKLGALAGNIILAAEKETNTPTNEYGLIVGTAFGPMETNFSVLDQVIYAEPTSPTLFSHSVFNAATGYLATIFQLTGCALTITDFSFPFFRALEQGYLMLLAGRLEACLILQIETYSELLHDARLKEEPHCQQWQPGVSCWLLKKGDLANQNGYQINALKITDQVKDKQPTKTSYLTNQTQITVNQNSQTSTEPLGAAMQLTQALQTERANGSLLNIRIAAEYGQVSLDLR